MFGVAAIFPYRRYGRGRPGTEKENLSETRKWNTEFHRKISNGKTGPPFQKFNFVRKFSSEKKKKNHVPFTTQPKFPQYIYISFFENVTN